jgi:hypothetical protein
LGSAQLAALAIPTFRTTVLFFAYTLHCDEHIQNFLPLNLQHHLHTYPNHLSTYTVQCRPMPLPVCRRQSQPPPQRQPPLPASSIPLLTSSRPALTIRLHRHKQLRALSPRPSKTACNTSIRIRLTEAVLVAIRLMTCSTPRLPCQNLGTKYTPQHNTTSTTNRFLPSLLLLGFLPHITASTPRASLLCRTGITVPRRMASPVPRRTGSMIHLHTN